jgi:hypothetical protein
MNTNHVTGIIDIFGCYVGEISGGRSIKMPKVSDMKSTRSRMFLFKGEFKTAKTTAAASFPDPIYTFDIDGRMGWLNMCRWLKGKDHDYDTYTDWEKVTKKLEQLEERCDFATIHVGSLTSLSRATINTLFRNRGEARLNTARKREKLDEPLMLGGIPIMGIADYSGESSGLNIILTQLRVIHNVWKCNVILECHVVTGSTPQLDGGFKEFRRIVTGGNKVAAEVPGYFDEIYHFYCDAAIDGTNRRFICHTRSNTQDFAGTAIPDLPDTIDHTNEDFYKIWSSYLPKDETAGQIIPVLLPNGELPDINL